MEQEMPKVGDKVKVIDPSGHKESRVGDVLTIKNKDLMCYYFEEVEYGLLPSRLELIVSTPSLANTKINVQAYADNYGLTLEQAHREVQQFAFDNGYTWCTKESTVCEVDSFGLFFDTDNTFCKTHDPHYFQAQTTEKEITLSRNIQHTISFVEPPVKERERITLNGKDYYKDELEQALSLIKPVSE